ncbi:efflux RND transporter permease subunit [Niveibacterium microcysteis]|uniref:Efflux RND transporter permease subunit n=1 Tax=Niveibacterium microcysteis TaxID=2811415 RepID=A0ABX7MAA8_9RHOO|nr:efflux RND transporter permease subunit [Niveibacterium microcysteis]QSI78667.1 efflux RND transporter permease subunit [Niveibacterium microcysteis]
MAHSDNRLGVSGRIAALFQRNAITPLLALVLFLLGVFAAGITPREEEPQINVTMANVLIPFPGASSTDVERLVAGPAEQVLDQIAGVEHTFSVSRPGLAILTVQFKVGVPRTEALVRLYDTLHSNRDWLPAGLGVLEPIVKPKGIDDVPIVALTLWTKDPDASAFELERVAHALEAEIKRVKGTREVSTIGGPGNAVNVWLDADRLAAVGMSVGQVTQALQARNLVLPGGELASDNRLVRVEVGTYLADAREVADVVIGSRNGRPVYLSDVARVEAGAPMPGRYVWHGVAGSVKAEYPAVTLQVTKKAGENAVDVAAAVIERVGALQNQLVPANVELSVTRNYGQTANDKATKLIQKLAFATASVIALVWFALGRREAAIVGAAVILTLAATLFASWAWGFTLNRVSLFALIFSIGILVDDAIVVVENIHRHRALEPDKPLWEVIPGAVDEVGGPTILATLTVIAALLPMAFVSGLMGPYMSPIPINSSMGMLLSLAIAFIVTPWLANKWLGAHHGGAGEAHSEEAREGKVMALARKVLGPFLDPQSGKSARRKLWAGVGGAIVISLALPVMEWVVLKMLPFDNKSEFQVVVDMPPGTPVEDTAAVLREMGAAIAKVPEVTDYQAYAGTASPINFNGLVRQYYLRASTELGDIQVNLVDKHHRSRKSHEIALAVRPELQAIAKRHGARVKVVEVPPGPPVLSPIVAEVYGPDDAGRRAVTKQVLAAFDGTADIVDTDSTDTAASPQLTLRVKQGKAAQLGVNQAQIAQALYAAGQGADATYLHDGQSKYAVPVRLELPPEKLSNLDALLKLPLNTADGRTVPLADLVDVVQGERDRVIYHKDLMPVTYVVGDMAGKLDSPLYGMFGIRAKLNGLKLEQGGTLGQTFIRQPDDAWQGYALKWDGEWQVTYETFRDMGAAYAVGLILIYLLVVAQFKSYMTPLVIMAPIPLTIVGVMPGHALLGAQYTATSMIGMIALAGIIVRNSILLVDFINLQVEQGLPFREAVIRSAGVRAQPIVLTAVAAMLGALFILDDPIFNGLAVSLLFGIAVSTLLTLVVIPILYYALNQRRFA